jgi:hypothetical protein
MKRLLALALVLGFAAVDAQAQVVDIAWGDMGPGCTSGERNDTFACASNAASNNRTIVTSFISPDNLPEFVGMTCNLRLITDGAALPDWWKMGAGECRSNGWGAVASPTNLGLVECADPWGSGSFIGGVTHLSGDGGADRARIVSDLATDIPQQLTAGTKYYGEAITLTVLRTTGTGSCAGCTAGACLILESIELYQVAGAPGGDVIRLTNTPGELNPAYLSWQAPIDNPGGCNVTPARNKTWGQVKSLYR